MLREYFLIYLCKRNYRAFRKLQVVYIDYKQNVNPRVKQFSFLEGRYQIVLAMYILVLWVGKIETPWSTCGTVATHLVWFVNLSPEN